MQFCFFQVRQKAEGYAEGATTLYNKVPVSRFINSSNFIDVLQEASEVLYGHSFFAALHEPPHNSHIFVQLHDLPKYIPEHDLPKYIPEVRVVISSTGSFIEDMFSPLPSLTISVSVDSV